MSEAGQSPTVGNRAVGHSKWIVSAPVAAKLLGLGATMVLARLLVPADFGVMAYVATTLAFFSVFQDLGITQALIADPGDVRARLRPAFYTSMAAGLSFYAVLAAAAFPLAAFVGEPKLGPILAAMGLVLPLQTAAQVQHALLVRREAYRWLWAVTVTQAVIYVGVAVGLAGAGFGVWSLAIGHLAAHTGRTSLLWIAGGWRPWSPIADGERGPVFHAGLLRFGGTLAVVNLLDWAADGWVFFTIGKVLGSEALGLYNLCFEASRFSYFGLPALAASVVLTSYASLLDKPQELRRLMLKGLRVVHSIAFPAAAGIAALAPWIVPLVWGERWRDAVPLLSVLALLGFAAPLPNVLLPYFVSAGRLKTLLRLTVARLLLYGLLISLAAGVGVRAVAITHVSLMALVSGAILWLAARRVGAGAAELRGAVLWPALRAVVCGTAAGATARVLDGLPPPAVLPPAVLAGAAVYLILVYATDREAFFEAASVVARGSGVMRHGR